MSDACIAPPCPVQQRLVPAAFAQLGSAFHAPIAVQALHQPHWVAHSHALARELNLPLDWQRSESALALLSGCQAPQHGSALASVYSGHQFGQWAGQLGDGRAILLGEIQEQELQLKGAGRTPFSRMGDGRAVLRSSIREFLCSEAMHALGVSTTRALCVTGSPQLVQREEAETAAVVTRVAPSFIRFGHFEHFANTGQHEQLRALADWVIARFYPDCSSAAQPYAAFLEQVTRRTAEMLAQWQALGFCHGVMNTDNMSILGLTIDYGPFGFLDGFDPQHICNHSDNQGRYAYHRQPNVAYWNLFCLGQALMPLIDDQAPALAALETYKQVFPEALNRRMAPKLGFAQSLPGLPQLSDQLLQLMASTQVDYTLFWRTFSEQMAGLGQASARDLFLDRAAFDAWRQGFEAWCDQQNMKPDTQLMLRTNPAVVLRNHLAQNAIDAAQKGDFSEVAQLLAALQSPFALAHEHTHYASLPPDWAKTLEVSCSS
jgi:serine/tyrosine/threonine adenylyltransferase